jgi:hypothetical protein
MLRPSHRVLQLSHFRMSSLAHSNTPEVCSLATLSAPPVHVLVSESCFTVRKYQVKVHFSTDAAPVARCSLAQVYFLQLEQTTTGSTGSTDSQCLHASWEWSFLLRTEQIVHHLSSETYDANLASYTASGGTKLAVSSYKSNRFAPSGCHVHGRSSQQLLVSRGDDSGAGSGSASSRPRTVEKMLSMRAVRSSLQ